VTSPKNQGQCGGCWAFATAATMEGAYFQGAGDLLSLSEQELIDCDTSWNQGCNGGLPDHALKYLTNHNLDTE